MFETKKSDTKEWTLMFYFASDNPLAPGIVSQLKAIKSAGFHKEANVIARFDPHPPETQTHIFEVNLVNKLNSEKLSNVGFDSNDPFVRNLVTDKLWAEEKDSDGRSIRDALVERFGKEYKPPQPVDYTIKISEEGKIRPKEARTRDDDKKPSYNGELNPKDSLYSFLKLCRESYPARHYILFILGHGIVVGNDLFLLDEHANGDRSLTLKELGIILGDFTTGIKDDAKAKGETAEFELLSFHNCSMSGLEVAYELKGTANYMLASQGPAFVGSWPYRNILIRIFNDLNSYRFEHDDLIDARGLASKILSGEGKFADFLRAKFDEEGRKLLSRIVDSNPEPEYLELFLNKLTAFLEDADLYDPQRFAGIPIRRETNQLITQYLATKSDRCDFDPNDLKRLNRRLLGEAFPREIERINVRRMLKKIFYYCLYNSYDFQLAGYSFDLCLTDLRRLSDERSDRVKAGVDNLSQVLCSALSEQLAQELILLAHWEAQSYWEENYTDLYDFCFCLKRRCDTHLANTPGSTAKTLSVMAGACESMMRIFESHNGPIVACAYAGPTYQYSHGLSIFFPWSEPVADRMWAEQYGKYKLVKEPAEGSWKTFLKKYFETTMRKVHVAESCKQHPHTDLDDDARLLEEITRLVFNEYGQLKDDPNDKTGPKDDHRDPTGDGCVCPTIKNYPPFSRSRKSTTSPNFFDGLQFG